MNCNTNSIQNTYISVLNVIASFAVVVIHCNWTFWVFSAERYWFYSNIIEAIAYFAVPLFYMITGATLIDYREKYSTKEFFSRRIKKTVIPFFVWSIIAVVVMNMYGDIILKGNMLNRFKKAVELIINTEALEVYWFFIPLFGIYLCIPIFSAIEKELRKRIFIYIAVIAFVLDYILPIFCKIISLDYHNKLSMAVGTEYLLYVVVGYLLHIYDLGDKAKRIIFYFAIMGLMIHISGTYTLSIEEGEIVRTFKGYTNLPCFLYSIGVYIYIKDLVNQKRKGNRFIGLCTEVISKYTFGVYLLHMYIIRMANHIGINAYSLWYKLFMPFVIYTLCIIIIWIVRKIPIACKLFP